MRMDRGYLALGYVDCGRLRLRTDPHKGEVSVDVCGMRILDICQSADTGYLHFLVYVSCLRISRADRFPAAAAHRFLAAA